MEGLPHLLKSVIEEEGLRINAHDPNLVTAGVNLYLTWGYIWDNVPSRHGISWDMKAHVFTR